MNRLIGKFASRQLIHTTSSRLNPVLEVVSIGERLMLNSANTNYSFGGLHRVFQKAFQKFNVHTRNIGDVLILGFGAGSVASILREELEIDCSIVGVEKDELVIKLAKKYFNTDRFANLQLVVDDAARYMRSEERKYDMIIVDVYVDFEVPPSCETSGFVTDLDRCLRPGGIMVYNKLVYNHEAAQQAKKLEEKFKKLGGSTRVIKVKENILNRIIVYEQHTLNKK